MNGPQGSVRQDQRQELKGLKIKETVGVGAETLPTPDRGTKCTRMHAYLPLVVPTVRFA